MAATDTEAQARAVERDIERTRNEMDATLSELEKRLAPSEIVHQGAETVRERARGMAYDALEALKRHPVPVALVVGLAVARYASRPSAAELLRLQADDDLDRLWRALKVGMTRAKEEGYAREADLERRARQLASEARDYVEPALRGAEQVARRGADDVLRLLKQAAESSSQAARALRDGAGTHPVAALALVGLAAFLGARRRRARS
jgi:hypothetical protein